MRAKKIILTFAAFVACMCIVCTSCSKDGGGSDGATAGTGGGSTATGIEGVWISDYSEEDTTTIEGKTITIYSCMYLTSDKVYVGFCLNNKKTVYYEATKEYATYTKNGNTITITNETGSSDITLNGKTVIVEDVTFTYAPSVTAKGITEANTEEIYEEIATELGLTS